MPPPRRSRPSNSQAPGFDGIDSKIAKALPRKGILFLVLLFNSMLRIHHFPTQWRCAVIPMIPKPGKPENLVASYRPISLLPTFSTTVRFESVSTESTRHQCSVSKNKFLRDKSSTQAQRMWPLLERKPSCPHMCKLSSSWSQPLYPIYKQTLHIQFLAENAFQLERLAAFPKS